MIVNVLYLVVQSNSILMKKFLLLFILFSWMTSCKKCGDCMYTCDNFNFSFTVKDNISGLDITGDDLNQPNVRYLLDSIKYQVIAHQDTSPLFFPNINRSDSNTINVSYIFSDFNIQDPTGDYFFILHLNELNKDTIKIRYQKDSEVYHLYQSDSLVGTYHCGSSHSLIIKK